MENSTSLPVDSSSKDEEQDHIVLRTDTNSETTEMENLIDNKISTGLAIEHGSHVKTQNSLAETESHNIASEDSTENRNDAICNVVNAEISEEVKHSDRSEPVEPVNEFSSEQNRVSNNVPQPELPSTKTEEDITTSNNHEHSILREHESSEIDGANGKLDEDTSGAIKQEENEETDDEEMPMRRTRATRRGKRIKRKVTKTSIITDKLLEKVAAREAAREKRAAERAAKRAANLAEKRAKAALKPKISREEQLALRREKRKATNPVQCSVCDKVFSRIDHLNRHKSIHTGQKPFDCEQCGKSFRRKEQLAQHKLKHSFACEKCSLTFSKQEYLDRHQKKHFFNCELCKKQFDTKEELREHIPVHEGEKPNQCQVCGKAFQMKKQLSNHMVVHKSEDPYFSPFTCELCGQCFKTKKLFVRHQIGHTGRRDFTCDICGKAFKVKADLHKHNIIHYGQRTFQCHKCDKSFLQNRDLKRHLLNHSDARPFQCGFCGKGFKNKHNYNMHCFIHLGKKPFQCNICSQNFRSGVKLKEHRETNHPEVAKELEKEDQPDLCNYQELKASIALAEGHLVNGPASAVPKPTTNQVFAQGQAQGHTVPPQAPAVQTQPQQQLQQPQIPKTNASNPLAAFMDAFTGSNHLVEQNQASSMPSNDLRIQTMGANLYDGYGAYQNASMYWNSLATTASANDQSRIRLPEEQQIIYEKPTNEHSGNAGVQNQWNSTVATPSVTPNPAPDQEPLPKLYSYDERANDRPNAALVNPILNGAGRVQIMPTFETRDENKTPRFKVKKDPEHEQKSTPKKASPKKTATNNKTTKSDVFSSVAEHADGKLKNTSTTKEPETIDANDVLESAAPSAIKHEKEPIENITTDNSFNAQSDNDDECELPTLHSDDEETVLNDKDAAALNEFHVTPKAEPKSPSIIESLMNAKHVYPGDDGIEIVNDDDGHPKEIHYPIPLDKQKRRVCCPVCQKILSRYDKLANHVRTAHGTTIKYIREKAPTSYKKSTTCHICDKSYSKRDKLLRHQKRAHPKLFSEAEAKKKTKKSPRKSQSPKKRAASQVKADKEAEEDLLKAFDEDTDIENGEDGEEIEKEDKETVPVQKGKETLEVESKELRANAGFMQCPLCEELLSRRQQVIKHCLTAHDTTLIIHQTGRKIEPRTKASTQCPVCNKQFKRRDHMLRHKRIHTGEKRFSCEICGQTYVRRESLDKHIANHNPKCELCNLTFDNKVDLHMHLLTHESDLPNKCEVCGMCFQLKIKLKKHMHIHNLDKSKDFFCDQCGESFRYKRYLDRHLVSHTGRRDYVCQDCGKAFKVRVDLTKHRIIHGEKKYKCTQCDKAFFQIRDLKRHLFNHSDIKPFACDECGHRFKNKYNLKIHQMTHTNTKPYECKICTRNFRSGVKLREHQTKDHGIVLDGFGKPVDSSVEAFYNSIAEPPHQMSGSDDKLPVAAAAETPNTIAEVAAANVAATTSAPQYVQRQETPNMMQMAQFEIKHDEPIQSPDLSLHRQNVTPLPLHPQDMISHRQELPQQRQEVTPVASQIPVDYRHVVSPEHMTLVQGNVPASMARPNENPVIARQPESNILVNNTMANNAMAMFRQGEVNPYMLQSFLQNPASFFGAAFHSQ